MKKLFALALLIAGSVSLFAQPANDDCIGLIDLGEAPICPIPDTFHNVDATLSVVFSQPNENIPSCFEGGVIDRDVWFSFQVPVDGSVTDFTISVTGVDGPNGSITQPQVAVYRGDCELDGLQELDCATSSLGETEVVFDLLGLTPGLTYFLRIADWTASAMPNWGDFVLCVDEYDPVFNMGDAASTTSCAGTLFDSGGPNGDYGNSENFTFTICPDDFHQCIFIDLTQFNIETNFDNLTFFAGDDTSDPQITNVTGAGGGIELQTFSDCLTVQFTSDGSVADAGWELTWMCSPDTCTIPPPSTCDDPTDIPGLPYSATDLTTCNAFNSVTTSPCNNNFWLNSEDYIFTYTSPGDECISVSVTGASLGTGVGVFNGCPNTATDCLGQAGGGFVASDPEIAAVFLEEPGTYYIVVDNSTNCTPFDIDVQQVECPVIFPSAALCEDALSLNGCDPEGLPAVISVAPGEGDAGFIQPGVNDGCWGGFPPNFTWFFFQAQEDGNFGFILDAANPAEASDIDFQVWGPIENPLDLCDFAANNQPIRSSYAAGADPTGLADIHPVLGIPVTDVCETAVGDDFVSTIPVITGEYYIILVNDWGGAIASGAISIGFDATTPGVLNGLGANFQVSADTSLCPGESAQLFASGGDLYQWFPGDGLSCVNCQDPVATITEATTYSVVINSLCSVDTLEVEMGLLQVDAGPDQTVCIGEEVQIIAGSNFTGVTYQWDDPQGFFSCTDCPDPFVTPTTDGTFTFEVTVTGPSCSFSDEMTLTVLPGTAPAYEISDDQALCLGETTTIGGNETSGVDYSWTSVPMGFTSTDANPTVTPSETTTYYLEIEGGDCPLASFDSVTVTVAELPVVDVAPDVSICIGESTVLGSTVSESGVSYTWTPTDGLDDPNSPNPTATPAQTTEYTLVADRNGCQNTETILVEVVQLGIEILNDDTIGICRDVEVSLSANAFPAGVTVNWSPDDGSLNSTTGTDVIATPQTATSYIAEIEVDGCVKLDTVYIGVDSLPWNLDIVPADTQICQGEQVLLVSETYEPADFMDITFEWTGDGQLTPDSLFNMVAQPSETTEYIRTSSNGFCTESDTALVTVIDVSSVMIEPAQPEICPGESIQLTATSAVPVGFTWSPADGLSCTECPDPTASPSSTTSYTVEADFDGCPVAAGVTVTVVPPPSVTFPPTLLCPGDAAVLNQSPNADYIYSWTSPDDPGFMSTDPAPTVTPSTTTTYEVVIDNGICPPVTESITLFVSDQPTLEVSEDMTICGDETVTLTATSNLPGTFTWEPSGFVGDSFTPDLQQGVNTYTVTYTNACGDVLTETVTVEVFPGIAIDSVTVEPMDTVFEGTPLTLTVFTDVPALSYQWSSGGTTESTEVTALTPPAETYSVTVTDDLGCTDVEEVSVTVNPTLWEIPNVFTPNGDGTNDIFQVIISGENVVVENFQIWNRWGELVFDADENSGALQGWDGNQGDEPATSDVYVYRIVVREPDGTVVSESGDVTLLR